MLSSASSTSSQQPLHISHNNKHNTGIIGDGFGNIINYGNNNRFKITQAEETQLDSLLEGYVSKDALYDSFNSSPEFHPNTRKTIRNEIGEWIDESGSEKSFLLWLNGPVGVGKSAIARSIAASHDQLVVATFFFSTSLNRSASTLIPTLAWKLARTIPDTRKHIIAALKNSGSLQTTQIEKQFNLLIIEPMKKSTTTFRPRPVMVIDGVDECIDESLLDRFLRVLVTAGEHGGMPIRFIICSRPEPRIRAILGRVHDVNPTAKGQELQFPSLLHRVKHLVFPTFQVYHSRFQDHLHSPMQRSSGFTTFTRDVWELYRPIRLDADKVDSCFFNTYDDFAEKICHDPAIPTIQIGFSDECKADIERYLTDAFNAIPHPGDGTSPWFQRHDILDLVKASCGQFLYASTIVKLIHEPHFDPRDVFKMARHGSLPTRDLNELYRAILKRAQDTIREQAKEGGPDYQTEWGFVTDTLAILVFLAGNVHFFTVRRSFPIIEGLLGLGNGKLTKKLCKLHSVLGIIPGESIQIHHRSFLDFLQNQERSGEYYISQSTALRRIFILMGRTGIRYNIFQTTVGGFIFKTWPKHVIETFLNDLDFQTF